MCGSPFQRVSASPTLPLENRVLLEHWGRLTLAPQLGLESRHRSRRSRQVSYAPAAHTLQYHFPTQGPLKEPLYIHGRWV